MKYKRKKSFSFEITLVSWNNEENKMSVVQNHFARTKREISTHAPQKRSQISLKRLVYRSSFIKILLFISLSYIYPLIL
jgi:hypothetical protein